MTNKIRPINNYFGHVYSLAHRLLNDTEPIKKSKITIKLENGAKIIVLDHIPEVELRQPPLQKNVPKLRAMPKSETGRTGRF